MIVRYIVTLLIFAFPALVAGAVRDPAKMPIVLDEQGQALWSAPPAPVAGPARAVVDGWMHEAVEALAKVPAKNATKPGVQLGRLQDLLGDKDGSKASYALAAKGAVKIDYRYFGPPIEALVRTGQASHARELIAAEKSDMARNYATAWLARSLAMDGDYSAAMKAATEADKRVRAEALQGVVYQFCLREKAEAAVKLVKDISSKEMALEVARAAATVVGQMGDADAAAAVVATIPDKGIRDRASYDIACYQMSVGNFKAAIDGLKTVNQPVLHDNGLLFVTWAMVERGQLKESLDVLPLMRDAGTKVAALLNLAPYINDPDVAEYTLKTTKKEKELKGMAISARIAMLRGDLGKARDIAGKVLAKDRGEGGKAHEYVAEVQAARGDVAGADETAMLATKDGKPAPFIMGRIGVILAACGDYNGARKHVAVAQYDRNYATRQAALIMVRDGELAEATKTLVEARAPGESYFDVAWAITNVDKERAGKNLQALVDAAPSPETKVWAIVGGIEGLMGLHRENWLWPGPPTRD